MYTTTSYDTLKSYQLRGILQSLQFCHVLQLQEVNRHPWVTAGSKGELELEAPMMEVVQTHIIPSEEFIDDDVLRAMNSLGCFKDKEKLKKELLEPLHNTGKPNLVNEYWNKREARDKKL